MTCAWRAEGPYDVLYVGLTAERESLARRLHARAAAFVGAGLLDEVRALLARGYDPALPSLSSIGYREFVRVARGVLSPADDLEMTACMELALRREGPVYLRMGKADLGRVHAADPDLSWGQLAEVRAGEVAPHPAHCQRRRITLPSTGVLKSKVLQHQDRDSASWRSSSSSFWRRSRSSFID